MKFSPILLPSACALLGACSQFPSASPAQPAQPAPPPVAVQQVTPQADSGDRPWASFKTPARTPEGGSISGFSFSEKPGDASILPLTVQGEALAVSGQFFGKGASQWGGVAVNIGAPKATPVKAGDYKFFTIKLSSATSPRLRVRLVGPDEATQKMGCYPIVMQAVKPEMAEYRIPLERFAPESYCGGKGISIKTTLQSMTAVEVAEVAGPVRDRNVSFGVGAMALAR
jgi:hypothetical protein